MSIYRTDMATADIRRLTGTRWTTVTVKQGPYDVKLEPMNGQPSCVGLEVKDDVPFDTVQVIAEYLGRRLGREVRVSGQ